YDIAFADASGNALDFQVEKYDPVSGNLIVWVRIPSLSPNVDTEVKLYYGNGSVTENPSTETTFSSCYLGRWHMDGNPAQPGAQLTDVTPNNNNAIANGGMTAANKVAGIIGDATEYDGVDDFWNIAGNIQPGTSFTLGSWVRSNQADANYHGFIGNQGGAVNQRAPSMWIYNNTALHFGFGNGANWQAAISPANVISNNNATWNYVVWSYDGTTYRVYTDGNLVYTSNAFAGSVPYPTPISWLGKVDNFFKGRMDETSVATCVRSQDWVKTEYSNVSNPATFYTVNPGAPTLTVVTPAENALITGTNVSVTYARSGLQTNVTGVRFTLDGGTPVTDTDLDGAITLAGVAAGPHTLTAVLMNGGTPLANAEATDVVNFSTQAATNGYSFYKTLTIQEEYVFGTVNHVDFPVLVSLTDPDLRSTAFGGDVQNAGGFDITFYDAANNPLSFQVEKYNPQTGELIAWVKIPSLSPSVDTDIKMAYGNTAITSDPSSENTWKSCYLGRWHMSANPGAAGPQLTDVTVNTNNGTANGAMTVANRVPGIIGDATNFDGTDDSYNIGNIVAGNTFTLSAWISSNQTSGTWHGFLGNAPAGVETRAPSLWVYETGGGWTGLHGGFGNGAGWAAWATGPNVVSNNGTTWNYVAASFDGVQWVLYVNGIQALTYNANSLPTNTPISWIGRVDNFFRGRMDEVSVSNCVHSADWVRTEYNSQVSPATFVTVGGETSFPVELLSFTATPVEGIVELDWVTATERSNDYFVVERSADGVQFTDLTSVDGSGDSDVPQSYQAEDMAPLFGHSWYRLRQVDFNGAAHYSEKVEVTLADKRLLASLYPNPGKGIVHIEVNEQMSAGQAVSVTMYNSFGQKVMTQTAWPTQGEILIDVSALSEGAYFVEVSVMGKRSMIPFQVR
ncbi:MAG: DUF2341 domain-containing protein, partial [Bacteroidetes bacterium]